LSEKNSVLAIFAHPDDAEMMCSGTLALLKRQAWQIHLATMTAGDCGSAELSRQEISRIRQNEARTSAQVLGGTYHCLECDDVFIFYDRMSLLKAIDLLRRVRPSLVFTHSPQDYMVDHEITSLIVQTACFAGAMKNIETDNLPPLAKTPYLYYADPMEGKDKFGQPIQPHLCVDISSSLSLKEQMLACHASQRNWLLVHHGVDEYLEAMKKFSRLRGDLIQVDYAEGFRRHLGHGFPADDLLKQLLPDCIHYL